jgi:hypothetical protein
MRSQHERLVGGSFHLLLQFKKIEAKFGGHPPRAPTDTLWAAAWIVPSDYPTGTFAYKVTATDLQGNSRTWEPFKIATSRLTILAGDIEIKKPCKT